LKKRGLLSRIQINLVNSRFANCPFRPQDIRAPTPIVKANDEMKEPEIVTINTQDRRWFFKDYRSRVSILGRTCRKIY